MTEIESRKAPLSVLLSRFKTIMARNLIGLNSIYILLPKTSHGIIINPMKMTALRTNTIPRYLLTYACALAAMRPAEGVVVFAIPKAFFERRRET